MEGRVRSLRRDLIKNKDVNNPWRPIGLYALFGFLWILLSDRLLTLMVDDHELYEMIQTFKGGFYVVLTAAGLYFLIKFDNAKIYALNKSLSFQNEELVAYSEEVTAIDQELHDKIDELNLLTEKLKIRENELLELATKDHLTKLQNRVKYEMDLESYILSKEAFNVIIVGLDNFKNLNNFHGHNYGDSLLRMVAIELASAVGFESVYRVSGSEFIVVLPHSSERSLQGTIECIKESISQIDSVCGLMYTPSACIGIVTASDVDTIDSIYKKVNVSLLHARKYGSSTIQNYSESFEEQEFYNIRLDEAIKESIDLNEFQLNYQPIYRLETGAVTNYEVLLRWPDNELGERNIGNVISRAEKTGQILELDKWVIHEAFQNIKDNIDVLGDKIISINISSQSFHSKRFYEYFMKQVKAFEVDPSIIEIEVTEHSILEDFSICRQIMEDYKKAGFKIALDDFGTKYSSLNYLSKLPFDTLKIDKSYIDDITANPTDKSIVKHIIDLSHDLGLEVVAEGIEYKEQEDLLKAFGCACGQGYLKSKPLDMASLKVSGF